MSLLVDLERGTKVGLELSLHALAPKRVLPAARQLLASQEVRVAGTLFARVGAGADFSSALQDLAHWLKSQGRPAADLALTLSSDTAEELLSRMEIAVARSFRVVATGPLSSLIELLRNNPRLRCGVRPEAPPLSRAEPYERAMALELGRIGYERGLPLYATNVDTVDDLVFGKQANFRFGSGRLWGGVSSSVPRVSAFHRTLVRIANQRAAHDPLFELEQAIHEVRTRGGDEGEQPVLRELEKPLLVARNSLVRAVSLWRQASEMARIAEGELGHLLEGLAHGRPVRGERFVRCENSFEEARALESCAQDWLDEAIARSANAQSALRLRRELLLGKSSVSGLSVSAA